MRRLWRSRWNGVARADFRRHFGLKTVATVVLLALLFQGVVVWVAIRWNLEVAGVTSRVILTLAWFLAAAIMTAPVSTMFMLDNKLNVTEAWLMTSGTREDLLWSRLAGLSAVGPLLVLLLAPLYFLAAATIPAEQCGYFVCGHLARIFSFAPIGPAYDASGLPALDTPWTSLLAAGPVAAAAMIADLSAALLLHASMLTGGLQQVSTRRFFSNFGRFFRQSLGLFGKQFGLGLAWLLLEVGVVMLAVWGFYVVAELSGVTRLLATILLILLPAALLVTVRGLFTVFCVKSAAASYDAILCEDDPL